jgi:phage baseplate assembly protein W
MIPHFDVPFRINGARGAVVNDQDSDEEILVCVESVIRYEVGQREEKPEFGIPDLTFSEPEPDVSLVRDAIGTWEPRASHLHVHAPLRDKIDELITTIRVEVGGT